MGTQAPLDATVPAGQLVTVGGWKEQANTVCLLRMQEGNVTPEGICMLLKSGDAYKCLSAPQQAGGLGGAARPRAAPQPPLLWRVVALHVVQAVEDVHTRQPDEQAAHKVPLT